MWVTASSIEGLDDGLAAHQAGLVPSTPGEAQAIEVRREVLTQVTKRGGEGGASVSAANSNIKIAAMAHAVL